MMLIQAGSGARQPRHRGRVSNKIKIYISVILLAVVTFGVYINSLDGDFLVDDQAGILNNAEIYDINLYFFKYLSLKPGILQEVAKVVLWHISPGKTYQFHLFNVLLHTGCTVLLFLLWNILFKNITLSFLSSLIFAVHPIHTEAVSWISGSPYVLSSFFYLAAVIFYVKTANSRPQHIFHLLLSSVFFVLCLLSGSFALTLPFMFILYDIFFRKDDKGNTLRWLVIFGVLLIAALLISMVLVSRNKFIHLIFYHRGLSYLVVAVKAFAYYLKILYLPLQRGLFHPFAFDTFEIQKLSMAFFSGLFCLFLAVFLFFRYRKKMVPVAFGIMFFLVTYAPYSNVIPVCNIIAERYLYLPSAGFSLIAASLFLKVWEIINRDGQKSALLRRVSVACITLFLGSYTALTIRRNYDYNNIITYWQSNIENFPDGYRVYNNLAASFYAMGNMENAKAYCLINLMINPGQPHVWCNLGKLYRETGDIVQARDCYQEALKRDSRYFPAHKALAELEKNGK